MSSKKNRRICTKCGRRILDVDFRKMNQCQQCGSSFCTECAADEILSTTDRYVCHTCVERNVKEYKIEAAILSKGW